MKEWRDAKRSKLIGKRVVFPRPHVHDHKFVTVWSIGRCVRVSVLWRFVQYENRGWQASDMHEYEVKYKGATYFVRQVRRYAP